MYSSLWTYPWDLSDLGIENSLNEIKETGLQGISLATSYHAGRFLQPRNPRRKVYFPEDGTLYFPINQGTYKHLKIQPEVATIVQEKGDILKQTIEYAHQLGMKVSAWTVCLHNTRIGMAYPDVTVKNAFGDPYYYNLCPNNNDVREYIKTFITDMTTRYDLYSIELESLNYMGYLHEFHHEKDGVGLTEKEQFLLSLCFCDSCKKEAEKAGINYEAARSSVQNILIKTFEQPLPDNDDQIFLAKQLSYFEDDPELYNYLIWRSKVVTALTEEVREIVPDRVKVYFLSLLTPSKSWLFGVDFEAISEAVDGIVVCCYDAKPEQVSLDVKESAAAASNIDLVAGVRVFYPEVESETELIDKIRRANQAGTKGYLFYNYGLIPKPRMEWIKNALESIQE